jgi:hypothetical protein
MKDLPTKCVAQPCRLSFKTFLTTISSLSVAFQLGNCDEKIQFLYGSIKLKGDVRIANISEITERLSMNIVIMNAVSGATITTAWK